jgi:hypothetical protein
MAKDNCISCGVQTPYQRDVNIEYRSHYVEGAGQMCKECWGDLSGSGEDRIYFVPESMIKDTPNDLELGSKVRAMFHKVIK